MRVRVDLKYLLVVKFTQSWHALASKAQKSQMAIRRYFVERAKRPSYERANSFARANSHLYTGKQQAAHKSVARRIDLPA